MSDEQHMIVLAHAEAKRRAHAAIDQADDGSVVTIGPPTRKAIQNAKLHGMLGDISKQLAYRGKKRTVKFWKGLLISGWSIAIGEEAEIIEGLEGELINIRESSTTLGIRRTASLIEYIHAYGDMNSVVWTEKKQDVPEYYR